MSKSQSPLIKAFDIQKNFSGFGGAIEVLKDINFQVHVGESVSIRGESGSGKTTFLNIISNLEKPDSGTLEWEERNILKDNSNKLAQQRAALIGFVFQSFYLVPELNALENVLLATRILGKSVSTSKRRARQLLDRVGLSNREYQLATQLSGGERQRVAIARALMNDPKVILADEPTGNLDEKTGLAVMDLLLELCTEGQTSLILVTHNLSFAKRTNRQLTLKYGGLENAKESPHDK